MYTIFPYIDHPYAESALALNASNKSYDFLPVRLFYTQQTLAVITSVLKWFLKWLFGIFFLNNTYYLYVVFYIILCPTGTE